MKKTWTCNKMMAMDQITIWKMLDKQMYLGQPPPVVDGIELMEHQKSHILRKQMKWKKIVHHWKKTKTILHQ